MKTFCLKSSGSRGERGNTLLIALSVAVIVAPIVAATLKMAMIQQRTVSMSQDWNAAMPIVEAGIEEAFAHLNRDCFSNAANNGVYSWLDSGWTQPTNGIFVQQRRTFPNGAYYDVRIETLAPYASTKSPDIVCVASAPTRYGVDVPGATNFEYKASQPVFSTITPIFAQLGLAAETHKWVKRQVRVKATHWTWADFGMLSGGDLVVNGQGTFRSFNSAGSDSFWGQYVPQYASDYAMLGSIGGDVNLGPNTRVWGSVETSPSGNEYGGTVGDSNWFATGNSGVQSNHYRSDLNMDMPEVTLPDGAASWPTLGPCLSGCTVTYIRPAVTNGTWTTTTNLPGYPVPGDYILTNTNDVVFSGTYYATPPGPPRATNYLPAIVYSYSEVPTNPFPANLVTNAVSTNSTNFALSVTLPADYPVNYATPPGVTRILRHETNDLNTPPPNNCYVGTCTILSRGNRHFTGNSWSSNYVYDHIWAYSYRLAASYSWTTNRYTYYTTTYSYYAPRTNNESVTDVYRYIAPPGDFQMASLSLSGQDRMLIRGPGRTRLYITGNLTTSGHGQIVIAPYASLEIYMGGNVSLTGNSMANEDDRAASLLIYGLPTCTSISIGGNGRFMGGVLAPNADFTANGGGSRGLIIGSFTANTITCNGGIDYVYDRDLQNHVPINYYVAADWNEQAVGAGPE